MKSIEAQIKELSEKVEGMTKLITEKEDASATLNKRFMILWIIDKMQKIGDNIVRRLPDHICENILENDIQDIITKDWLNETKDMIKLLEHISCKVEELHYNMGLFEFTISSPELGTWTRYSILPSGADYNRPAIKKVLKEIAEIYAHEQFNRKPRTDLDEIFKEFHNKYKDSFYRLNYFNITANDNNGLDVQVMLSGRVIEKIVISATDIGDVLPKFGDVFRIDKIRTNKSYSSSNNN